MNLSQWTDRGAIAASEDLRAGRIGEWDRSAVLTHLGIASEDDTDAVAYGLTGEELAAAQRVALAGYALRMERDGVPPPALRPACVAPPRA